MNLFWKILNNSQEDGFAEKVGQAIIRVASKTIVSDEAFQEEAQKVAAELGEKSIEIFPSFFHNPPKMPVELNEYYGGLGHWLSVCQFCSFEILYNFREKSLPVIRKTAFGEYDWIQGNAIEILCRFAAENIEREKIILDLKHKMPEMRIEALEYAVQPLLKQAKNSLAIQRVLDELDIEEFQEVIEESKSEEIK
jgi:hypothetical protein